MRLSARQEQLVQMMQSLTPSDIDFLSTYLSRTQKSHISRLSYEILFKIFSFLSDPATICKCAQVNRQWHAALKDNLLWREICRLLLISKGMANELEWKTVFKHNHLTNMNWKRGKYKLKSVAQLDGNGNLCMHFDEKYVVSVAAGQAARFWNLEANTCHALEMVPESRITAVKFDTQYLVTGASDGTISVRNASTKRLQRVLVGHAKEVGALHVYNDQVASGSEDCTCRVWNIETGECTLSLQGHNGAVIAVQMNDKIVVTGSADHTAKIWSRNGRVLFNLVGHTGSIYCLQFDSNLICTGSQDKTIRVWSKSGQLLNVLKGHHQGVICLQFDEMKLISGSADKTIKVDQYNPGMGLPNRTLSLYAARTQRNDMEAVFYQNEANFILI